MRAAGMPQKGDRVTFRPAAFDAGLPGDCPRLLTGTVEYIHPKGRYFVVVVEVNGHVWRESLYLD